MPRPRGRRNNATLIREAEAKRALKICEGTALSEAPEIVLAMAKKAKEGDVSAAKLILDRVYPAMRQVEDRADPSKQIVINITGDATIGTEETKDAKHSTDSETDHLEPVAAEREVGPGAEGGKVLALHAGEEG